MAEETAETLRRLAKAIRSEAADLEAKQVKDLGKLKDAIPSDRDWQRGKMDGLREAADLLDDGKGG